MTLTISGTFTGQRYIVSEKSTINVANRGTEFLPGSIAGTIAINEFCIYK